MLNDLFDCGEGHGNNDDGQGRQLTGEERRDDYFVNVNQLPPESSLSSDLSMASDSASVAMDDARDNNTSDGVAADKSGAGGASPSQNCFQFNQSDTNKMRRDIRSLLSRPQPYGEEVGFERGEATITWLCESCKVLVVGAGGLGCEILKNLSLSGFTDVHVIDMDNVDITNLNRQFLFRQCDVGRPKAVVAAETMNRRFGHLNVHVTHYVNKIQNCTPEFYSSFNIIIAGLDNIEARRWLNAQLHSLLIRSPDTGEIVMSTSVPFLDGGTEGFKGQARVILPGQTSCFDCSLEAFPERANYPLCTIAETPRLPEHCIEYAMLILWPAEFGDCSINTDSEADVKWLHDAAKRRSDSFGIQGVTYSLTLGVIKRIIPAVASCNALIAALLVNEAFKFATYCNPPLSNYLMYMGNTGVYTYTFEYGKKENCLVCGSEREIKIVNLSPQDTLQDVLNTLCNNAEYQLKRPSICGRNVVFMQHPPALRKMHEDKLSKTLKDLIDDDVFRESEPLSITDPSVGDVKITLRIVFAPAKTVE